MFELVFGLIWTVFSATMLAIVCITSGGGAIPVILFILLFVAIGLFVMWQGVKKIIANRATDEHGLPAFGMVIDVKPSGASINGRDILNAEVVVCEDIGVIGRYTESIGTSYNNFRVGDYVLVKYYNGDINIIAKADSDNVPQEVIDKFENQGFLMGQMPYGQVPYMPYGGGYQQGYNGSYQQGYSGGTFGGYNQGYQNGGYQDNVYQNNEYQNNVYCEGDFDAPETVVVDGVEYVKKEYGGEL